MSGRISSILFERARFADLEHTAARLAMTLQEEAVRAKQQSAGAVL